MRRDARAPGYNKMGKLFKPRSSAIGLIFTGSLKDNTGIFLCGFYVLKTKKAPG